MRQGLGDREQESGCRMQDAGNRSQESGCRKQETGVRMQKSGNSIWNRHFEDLKLNYQKESR